VQTAARNPSYNYTIEQFDDIIDRMLHKRRVQPTPDEVINLGIMNSSYVIEQYVAARWDGDRALVKRRTKTISDRIFKIVGRIGQHEKDPRAVWQVYSYEVGVLCFACGGDKEYVREFSWSMYGWMIPEEKRNGSSARGLNIMLVGMGGPMEVAKRMTAMIKSLEDDAKQKEKQARTAIKFAKQTRERVESIKLNILGSLSAMET
jgi:hypothetical protein